MSDYDVVVCGGGPSGATTAFYAARAGLRVALIDRAKFPRDKACGGLPLPDHPAYRGIEAEHNVAFTHTLVLARSTDDYARNIQKRGLANQAATLLKHYAWRESTKALHDEVLYNPCVSAAAAAVD